MVIKASAGTEIRPLIAALASQDEVSREAAIARLAVIGARAVDRLTAAYKSTGEREVRIAILRALEAISDPRAVPIARAALAEGGDLAVTAAGVLRGFLESPQAATSAEALDALVAAALDTTAERRVRVAAFDALQEMPAGVRERVAEALRDDPDALVRSRAADAPKAAAEAAEAWDDALEGRLPDQPGVLREALQARAPGAALTALQKLIDVVRAREGSIKPAGRRAEWQAVRGALHQALALRGSRLALYDLRETLEGTRRPLPPSFLAAVHAVGDASCLEPIAAAHARTGGADPRWAHQLVEAFRAVARRERITRRHAALKRIAAKWPAFPV